MWPSLGPKITDSAGYQPSFCRVTTAGVKSGKTRIFSSESKGIFAIEGKMLVLGLTVDTF